MSATLRAIFLSLNSIHPSVKCGFFVDVNFFLKYVRFASAELMESVLSNQVFDHAFLLQIHPPHLSIRAHQMAHLGWLHSGRNSRDVHNASFFLCSCECSKCLGRQQLDNWLRWSREFLRDRSINQILWSFYVCGKA